MTINHHTTSAQMPLTIVGDGDAIGTVHRMLSRREALRDAGKVGAMVALAGSGLGYFASTARGQDGGLPQQVVDILNYALTLEFLEASFYQQGLEAQGLIPDETQEVFATIQAHEAAHVDFLRQALGEAAVAEPQFDFTAGGAFDTFENYETFLLLSQAFEDTGVRAYKGQAGNLVEFAEILTAALTIHSVEARHAAKVRALRGLQPWIPFAQPDAPAPVAPVYAGMDQTTKFGVALEDISEVEPEQITEAYDEPLDMEAVLAIASSFLA